MAAFNVSVDDASPLISYSPADAWTDSPSNQSNAQSYSQESWHTSSSYAASATIQFNGTGIWFIGATGPTYGPYDIWIDGQSVAGSAYSQNASFQQFLGGLSGLANGLHTAVLTNTGSDSPIDLDSIVFETQIGSANETITAATLDDTSPDITYLPTPTDWVSLNTQGAYNDTLHYTQVGGAQAQFMFDGGAVAIFGTASPDHANYTVTMDGITQSFQGGSNGLTSYLHFGTLLYFTDGLTSGSHNLTLTAESAQYGQNNAGKFLDIDRIVVFSTSNGTTIKDDSGIIAQPSPVPNPIPSAVVGKVVGIQNLQGSTQPHHSKWHNVALIGGVIAGMFVLLLLNALVIILFRRRSVQRRGGLRPKLSIRVIRQEPNTPNLPMQFPPPWGTSPRYPEGRNTFLHTSYLEKGIGSPAPKGFEAKNPFTDDARVWVPEMGMMRAGNDDRGAGQAMGLQKSATANGRHSPNAPTYF